MRLTVSITGFRNEAKETVAKPVVLETQTTKKPYINCTFDGAKDENGVLLANLPITQYYAPKEVLEAIVVGQKMNIEVN